MVQLSEESNNQKSIRGKQWKDFQIIARESDCEKYAIYFKLSNYKDII